MGCLLLHNNAPDPSVLPMLSSSWHDKPARVQVNIDDIDVDDKPPQTGQVFNTWYLKWLGGTTTGRNHTPLKFRLQAARDSGRTRAKTQSPICLFYARGCCYLGEKCKYHHRLPSETDCLPPTKDCFGRDKTANYRDDMDGAGSFNKANRTLFVGGMHISESTEMMISQQFGEFARIDKVRILPSKNCAFVTCMTEPEAQFAKEAMQNQSISNNDVISVRWANEDPNPDAQRLERERMEQVSLEAVKRLLQEVDSDPEKDEPPLKKAEQSAPRHALLSMKPADNSTLLRLDHKSLNTLAKISAAKKRTQLEMRQGALSLDYNSDEDDD